MNREFTTAGVAWRIWLLTNGFFTFGILLIFLFHDPTIAFMLGGFTLLASIAGSSPAFVVILIALYPIKTSVGGWQVKLYRLLFIQFAITFCYGLAVAAIDIPLHIFFGERLRFIIAALIFTLLLFACACASTFVVLKIIVSYLSGSSVMHLPYNELFKSVFQNTTKNNNTMETNDHENLQLQPQPQSQSNRILIKGLITGGLILIMLIPTMFIINIIKEREQRQLEVVREVSSKWASAQTISGPYMAIPYTDTSVTSEGKTIIVKKQLILLANDLSVDGKIFPEERPRSIYKVLLYKSNVKLSGSFKPKWPFDINTGSLDLANAKLCFGISDFKGIEEEIKISFNNKVLTLSPGLPVNELDDVGLSVPVSTNLEELTASIPFNMEVKIKGSEQLHFMPLAANSKFSIGSPWPNPSFDGNVLPNDRQVTADGFTAKWNFNQANLPFGTVIRPGTVKNVNLAFGVSMVQPADQYDKTMRSVKYAILFIGLTFALFFIIEIMQRKPFHPVQYVLVGLALVIFYTLLLSISEYLLFDLAYLIASAATILLVSLYAESHFKNWKTTGVFTAALSLLYGFIFILIRLEDTALLVGSIGLFIVLALVMYASRKINWYGTKQ